MWQSLPNVLAVLATVSLGLSVIYDWAYLYWLGISFSEVPTTLSDHGRSALVWMPSAGVALFAMLILELINRRLEQGMTEQELIEKSKNPKFTKFFRESPFIVAQVFAAGGVVVYILWAAIPLETFLICSIIIWFTFSRWIFSHKRIHERTTPIFRIGIAIVPAIAIYFAYHGMTAAKADLSATNPEKVRTLSFKRDGKTIEGRILRSFENVTLLWIPHEKKIRIVPLGELDYIDSSFQEKLFRGVLDKKKHENDKVRENIKDIK